MKSFSWDAFKKTAEETKLRQEKTKARVTPHPNPDFLRDHPQEYKDAQLETPKFTLLERRIREKVQKDQKLAIDRRLKKLGKQG